MTPEEYYKEVVKLDMDKFDKKAPKFDYYDLIDFADSYHKKQLTLTDVVNCVYVVTERDNYGEQLFKGVFANREKAIRYLAEDGLKESNIDEINEIELD
jgi:hypothetical protein